MRELAALSESASASEGAGVSERKKVKKAGKKKAGASASAAPPVVATPLWALSRVTLPPAPAAESGSKKKGKKGKKGNGAKGRPPAGLAGKSAIKSFASTAKGLEKRWGSLNPQTRGEHLVDAANEQLVKAEVPEVGTVVEPMSANGVFKFPIWTTGMNETKLTGAKPPSGDIAGLANTAYHEARHAEQWFKMARLEVGTGDDAGTIAASTGIPVDITAKAVQAPILPKSAEGKEAQAWFDSVYGANRDHRQQVYEDKRTTRGALTPLAEARNTAVAEVNRLAEEYKFIPNTLNNISKRRKAYDKEWGCLQGLREGGRGVRPDVRSVPRCPRRLH